jgi:hypothetical protein
MLGLFNRKPYEPLDYDTRKWYEEKFLWLAQQFKKPRHQDRKIYTPTEIDFPIKWDKSEDAALQAIQIISNSLQINTNELKVEFFDTGMTEFNMGGSTLFLENDKANPSAAGMYFDKLKNGTYTIALQKKLLEQPDHLISIIAHELCHVKLLGERKIIFNDEHLTDLATVTFGFGIFNANSSFNFYTQSDRWGYQMTGYMKAPEWAYALALSAFYRKEENPEWKKYLNTTIKKDFERALKYMIHHEDDIFKFDAEDDIKPATK